jgi:hypothetical protein
MGNPLIYILAPAALAFGLFVVYLIVSIIIRDPARPFRMFKAPPLEGNPGSSERNPKERPEEEREKGQVV